MQFIMIKNNKNLKTLAVLALLPLAILLGGCFAVVAGGAAAGTVAYIRGDSETVVNKSLAETLQASRSTIDELGLLVVSQENDGTTAVIKTRNALDDKITFSMEAETDVTTRLSIRYGNFGDPEKANRILTKVTAKL